MGKDEELRREAEIIKKREEQRRRNEELQRINEERERRRIQEDFEKAQRGVGSGDRPSKK